MRGFQPAKGKAKPFANGGPVRGPGTGTSDEIPDEVPEGTYIMPADSTQSVGERQLATMGADGKGVPVQLSNGEFKMPPEQVHAIGAQVLDQMKNATHQPVARGFAPGAAQAHAPEPPMFFADGGEVKRLHLAAAGLVTKERLEEEGRVPGTQLPAPEQPSTATVPTAPRMAPSPSSPSNTYPGNRMQGDSGSSGAPISAPPPPATPAAVAAPAISPQAQSDRAKIGAAWDTVKDVNDDAGRAIADVAMLVPRGLVGAYDSAIVRPMRAAGVNANYLSPILVPKGVDPSSVTPFTDQKRMQQAGAPAATPVAPPTTTSTAPVTPATTASTVADGGSNVNQPSATPVAPPPSSNLPAMTQVAPGVFRSGNSYSDSADGAVAGAQPRGMPVPQAGGAVSPIGMSPEQAQRAGLIGERIGYNPAFDQRLTGGSGQPSAQNMAAADALAQRSQQESMNRVAAPQQGPAGWSGVIGQDPAAIRERKALMDALTTPVAGARGLTSAQRNGVLSLMNQESQAQQAKDRNATSFQQTEMQTGAQRDIAGMREAGDAGRAAMREQGENARAGARNAIDQGRLDLEGKVRGFDIRAGERQEALYKKYDAAKTPEEKAAVAQQIRDLSGKQTESPWKLQVTPATKNTDGTTSEGSILRYNTQTGQVERVDTGSKALPAIKDNPAATAIVNNTSLTLEQRRAELQKLGYN